MAQETQDWHIYWPQGCSMASTSLVRRKPSRNRIRRLLSVSPPSLPKNPLQIKLTPFQQQSLGHPLRRMPPHPPTRSYRPRHRLPLPTSPPNPCNRRHGEKTPHLRSFPLYRQRQRRQQRLLLPYLTDTKRLCLSSLAAPTKLRNRPGCPPGSH